MVSEEAVHQLTDTLTDLTDGGPVLPAPYLSHIHRLGVDVQKGRIYLGALDEGTGEWLAQTLQHLSNYHVLPVIWLNTPGGDVTEMFAIHDLIRASESSVKVVGYGQVMSAGVLLLACAHQRYVTESCVLMSHEPKGFGGADDEGLGFRAAKDRRKWEDWSHLYWCELMARYTPQDASWWKRTTERQAEF